jgi:hypothetical protein
MVTRICRFVLSFTLVCHSNRDKEGRMRWIIDQGALT